MDAVLTFGFFKFTAPAQVLPTLPLRIPCANGLS
jgi:hypothetical protein